MRYRHLPDWDWRIWVAALVTVVWLGVGIVYLATGVGWTFWREGAATIGGFFEGFFAPLAFLWLVVGLFIQQKELSRTRDEMRQSNVLAAQQASAIEASALTSRQQAFFLIAENVRRQTGNLLGVMLASCDNDLVGSEEQMEQYWTAHSAGDSECFPRLFVARDNALLEGNFGRIRADGEFFFGSPFRASLSGEYIRSFRRLLKLAIECDTEGAIRGTVSHTPHGLVYSAMLSQLRPPVAWLLLDGPVPTGPAVDVAGTWHVVFDSNDRGEVEVAEFAMRLDAGSDGLTGRMIVGGHENELEIVAVAGNALFFRGEEPIVFCATVEGETMLGRAESQYGDVHRFTATRGDQAG